MPEGVLPPISAPFQQPAAPVPPQPGQMAPPIAGARAPGRPSGDPDVEVRRQERHETRNRMMGVLPKRAIDDKVKIYKMRKGRVPPSARPVLEVLYSDLEKAKEEGIDPDQAIEDMLISKLGEDCIDRFLCKVFDRTGQPVASIPPWEVDLGDGEEDDLGDGDDDLGADGEFDDLGPAPGGYHRGFPMQPAPPPAAQVMDVQAIAAAARQGREEETKRSGDTLMMLTTMMQQQAQQQMLAKQEAAERDERYRRETLEREERIRRENLEREEREKTLRHENRQMLLGLVPVFLPLVQKVLGLDKQPGFDPGTQALIEVLKDRNKNDPTEAVTGMLPKIMEFQTTMAQTGMASMMNMQATVNKMNMDSVIDTMKRLKDEAGGSGKPEKSTMESIGEVLSVVAPMLTQGQQQAPVETPTLPAPAPQQQQQPAPRRRPPPPPPAQQAPAPAAPAAPEPAAHVDRPLPRQAPAAAVRSCLHAIRKMSTGEHPAEHRFSVLHWIAQRLPQPLLQALAAGNQDAVLQAGSGIVMADPVLLPWIQAGDNGAFLQEALNDLRVLITGKLTPEIAQVAIDQHAAFIRSHTKPPEPTTASAAAAPAAPTAAADPAPAAVEPTAPAAPVTPAPPETPAAGV